LITLITKRKGDPMKRIVYLVKEECIACGLCQDICPEVFRLNDEETVAEVIMPEGGPEDLIQEAIDACPVSCIHWKE
jgi:ferredoxin